MPDSVRTPPERRGGAATLIRGDERSQQVERLRYVVILRELNFTRAAETLGIAQPALSHQIRVLEREVGAILLTRSQRGPA